MATVKAYNDSTEKPCGGGGLFADLKLNPKGSNYEQIFSPIIAFKQFIRLKFTFFLKNHFSFSVISLVKRLTVLLLLFL